MTSTRENFQGHQKQDTSEKLRQEELRGHDN